MKVRELMELLSKCNPEAEVEIEYEFNDGYGKEVEEMEVQSVKDPDFTYHPTIYLSSIKPES